MSKDSLSKLKLCLNKNHVKYINFLSMSKDKLSNFNGSALELNHPSPEKFRIALESAAQAEIRFHLIVPSIQN